MQIVVKTALQPLCDMHNLSYILMDDPDPKHWLIRFNFGDKVCYQSINKIIFSRYNNVGKELYLYEIILSVIKILEDKT